MRELKGAKDIFLELKTTRSKEVESKIYCWSDLEISPVEPTMHMVFLGLTIG